MAGLVVAAIGLAISQVTGDQFFDGAASVVIGIILGLTALLLAVESKALLIGESADPELVEGLRALTLTHREVTGVGEILTLHSSPDQITVMMSVDFDDSITAGEAESIVDQIECEAGARWPAVTRLYIRPRRRAQDRTSLPSLRA
jgi:divalent metal cation (Fe/Co/Zn/Cd) transporter